MGKEELVLALTEDEYTRFTGILAEQFTAQGVEPERAASLAMHHLDWLLTNAIRDEEGRVVFTELDTLGRRKRQFPLIDPEEL